MLHILELGSDLLHGQIVLTINAVSRDTCACATRAAPCCWVKFSRYFIPRLYHIINPLTPYCLFGVRKFHLESSGLTREIANSALQRWLCGVSLVGGTNVLTCTHARLNTVAALCSVQQRE